MEIWACCWNKAKIASDFAEYEDFKTIQKQKEDGRSSAKKYLKEKHAGKKLSDINQTDLTEFMKLKMALDLDIDID